MKNNFKPFPIIYTDRCILSSINAINKNAIFRIYSDQSAMKYMQSKPLVVMNEAIKLIEKWNNQIDKNEGIRWGVFLKSSPNKLIGTIALQYWNKSSNCIELGADLLPEYWEQGLAYEFTKPAIDFAFDKLNINRLELRCNPSNIASVKVAKKIGMTYEGRLRQYVFVKGRGYDDEAVYSILKSEHLDLN